MANRWWVYQRERFPVLAHGPLIVAFSLSAMSYSALLRGEPRLGIPGAVVAFVTSLLFFLQLRVADEFKDFEDDARYRPYRPVPRGLVSLRELGIVGIAAALIQAALALWLKPALLLLLAATWVYFALMSVEFFAPNWLKARPVTYMWTHMLIMPLIDLYATACDWLVASAALPEGLAWFIAVSFFNGIVLEVGRKIRAPQDEEHGVETYSKLWGTGAASLAWFAAMIVCALAALGAAYTIRFFWPVVVILSLLLVVAAWQVWRFSQAAQSNVAKRFEHVSGAWTLVMYLFAGVIPLFLASHG
jgi:4-hydroxybenzoate polyprenyltransferase